MMRDDLVGGVADRRLDEDVEAARDEDRRDEAQQEKQDHVVPDERTAGKNCCYMVSHLIVHMGSVDVKLESSAVLPSCSCQILDILGQNRTDASIPHRPNQGAQPGETRCT